MISAEIRNLLERPFSEVGWKIQATNSAKDKGLIVAYIDARDVASRLDETGLEWSDSYSVHVMADTWIVECRLTVGGVTRTDVGTGDGDEAAKSAYSDALKRAAVKFGVGRYLYEIPTTWVPVETIGRSQVIPKEGLEKLHAAYRRKYGQAAIPAARPPVVQLVDAAPQPTPALEEPNDAITSGQIKALAATLRQAGFDSTGDGKAQGRAFLAYLAGRESLESAKDLTFAQAHAVLHRLADPAAGSEYRADPQLVEAALAAWYEHQAGSPPADVDLPTRAVAV